MSQESNASGFTNATTLAGASVLARVAGEWVNLPETLFTSRVISHKTADYTVLANESGTLFTNLGAAAPITFTLPLAVVGLHYTFVARAAQQLRVDPNGSQTLESTATPPVAGTAGQYIWADAISEFIHLICLETGKWAVFNFKGTWTVV